jgi:glutamyl-tRNA synthetase
VLYRAFGAPEPLFAHVPMILGSDGKRLSKRHGATAVGEYRMHGILPGALVNFLALLGWNPGDDTEVMAIEELIARFSLEGINRKSAVFDPQKLEWMNGQHLTLMPAERLEPRVTPAIVRAGLASAAELAARRDWYLALLDLLKVRARTIDDIVRQAEPYFREEIVYDQEAVAKQWKDRPATADMLVAVRERLAELPTWTPDAMEQALRSLAETRGVAAGKLFQPLRVALTGLSVSPGIFDVLALLGRERSLQRISQALVRLNGGAKNSR